MTKRASQRTRERALAVQPGKTACVVGVGGAERRINAAKLTTSESAPVTLVKSSGVALNAHPVTSTRSFGKASFDTPCSTLYASPEKIKSDLFWAFQPKRVTVPSLPEVFNLPPIPNGVLCERVAARLFCSVASGVFSTKPRP